MIANGIVIAVLLGAAALLFAPRTQRSTDWQATVTPLASIIGSGFLVSVPLLARQVGDWALPAMAVLVGAAWLVGAAIRFNIRHVEPLLGEPPKDGETRLALSLEKLSHFVLAFAYFVSVAYYLVLLGNFLLKGLGVVDPAAAKAIATVILATLGALGLLKGLGMVERIEKYSVGLNLAVIAGLIAGLLWRNGDLLASGAWQLPGDTPPLGLHSLQVLLGLLIVVQGFETSRFLGDEFDAETRIRTMRRAQLIAAAVYLAFFALTTSLFGLLGSDRGIAAIVGLVGHVALVLPLLLTVGAVASQFSASVADSVGCAGLLEDIAARRLSLRHAYPLIALVAVAITWGTDVFRLVTLASQAFALFYLVQACVALAVAWDDRGLPSRTRHLLLFAGGAAFCLSVVLFGVPAEG
ncbi:hypothetical protein SAMN06265365_11838 [Tistlia consotensis]|uniref:Uncharacterized protein n=1 Tax=Tistlia consotensis USBA 355 TaxID=560819 RepID=A0A1Y6CFH7_9PROT|nr:hypothetical protein [Tistlia consotensis]SMF53575.1 hypothetical protein SAMN05428998_11939 [Tistlia consotensis USBA 355]SNR85686.1 hypothetical protein SAMN06265365_11838 [Tistlia consotensis]